MSVLRLAIPTPLRRQFDYLPPPGTTPEEIGALRQGVRLRVPFGSRELTGYLVSLEDESPVAAGSLKPALELLDPEPLVDPRLLELCHWAADYYQHPIGEVYAALFPRRLREGGTAEPPGAPGFRLTTRGKGLPEGALSRSPRQAQAVALLQQRGDIATPDFRAEGISAAILRKLTDLSLVEPCVLSERSLTPSVNAALEANPEQAAALSERFGDEAIHNPVARTVRVASTHPDAVVSRRGSVCVVTAGTSDVPV